MYLHILLMHSYRCRYYGTPVTALHNIMSICYTCTCKCSALDVLVSRASWNTIVKNTVPIECSSERFFGAGGFVSPLPPPPLISSGNISSNANHWTLIVSVRRLIKLKHTCAAVIELLQNQLHLNTDLISCVIDNDSKSNLCYDRYAITRQKSCINCPCE